MALKTYLIYTIHWTVVRLTGLWVVRREPAQIITVIDCRSNLIDYSAEPDWRDSIAQNTQTQTYFYTKLIISLMLKSSRIIITVAIRAPSYWHAFHDTVRIYTYVHSNAAVSCGVSRMLDNINYGQFHLSFAFSYFQFLIYVALIENYEVKIQKIITFRLGVCDCL